MDDVLVKRCAKSQRRSHQIWQSSIQQSFPTDPRDALTLAAFALAHEHHSSIVQLIGSGHYAGAVALIRPLIEACLSGTWLLYCATESRANELLSVQSQFLPRPSRMWNDCAKNSQVGEGTTKFRDFMAGDGVLFHKFTHGDMPQLSRRFLDGKPQIPFTLPQNIATLIHADIFLILAGDLAGVVYANPNAKVVIGPLLREVLLEASQAFGTPFVWEEPWTGFEVPHR